MKPQAEIINSLTFGNLINPPSLSAKLASHSAAVAGLGSGVQEAIGQVYRGGNQITTGGTESLALP